MVAYDTIQQPMFESAFTYLGWAWAGQIVAWGQVILLPLVVLLSFIAQPELMAAMAVDGMLSYISSLLQIIIAFSLIELS